MTITIGGGAAINLGPLAEAGSPQERLGQIVEAINNKTGDTGVTAYLTKIDGSENYQVDILSNKLDGSGNPVSVTFGGADFSAASVGLNPAANPAGISLTGGAAPAAGSISKAQGIENIDVSTQAGAWVALQKIDSAVDQINSARATLGAMQSRFENAVNNIDIQSENLSAARGRIVDADFAKETANLSRTQILQQAGTAMVAQANQLPQQVLSLLR
ncbi:hypothetical protein SDC9_174500 [bioreactor metagenome]|uniref:Flagellin C-terminal domain-containing protein n=1 Tax=bioreactor metagenome TaxID=1076179 RepID=A0A645GTV0_9ZZZZ